MPRRKTVPNAPPLAPQEAVAATPAPLPVLPPVTSPAVVALQSQVVELVGQRTAGRQRLTQSHAEYLLAQSKFQAAQAELQGIEQEVQYRIGLIAQLENRQPMAPVLQMTSMPSIQGVSVDPAPAQRGVQGYGDPNDMVSRAHASRNPNELTGTMM